MRRAIKDLGVIAALLIFGVLIFILPYGNSFLGKIAGMARAWGDDPA